jgi:hypothetical protein
MDPTRRGRAAGPPGLVTAYLPGKEGDMGVRRDRLVELALALGVLAWAGCKDGGGPPTTGAKGGKEGGKGDKGGGKDGDNVHGHSHERAKSLLADAGEYHARLTAHLSSKGGNELDVFFETADEKDPKPVAIPMTSFTAQARTEGGELKELKFECAPADERPKGEKEGTCSHFVAKAPWMKPDETLYVRAEIKLDGKGVTVRWKDFVPKKYAHYVD